MPSFDIVSTVELQLLDNALNSVRKEIGNRFDFKGTAVEIELDKKTMKITLGAESEMKLQQLADVLLSRAMRQGIDPLALDMTRDPFASGKLMKREVAVRNGLGKEEAKKVSKWIKDSGLKVQAQIMDDLVRVSGKKIDDLQELIQLSKQAQLGFPLQFTNMKR